MVCGVKQDTQLRLDRVRRTWWPCCQPEAHGLDPKDSRAEPQKEWRDVDDWASSQSRVCVQGLEAGDLVAVVTFSEGRLEWGSLSQSSVCSTCATSSTGDRPATLRIVRSGSGGPLSTGHGRSRPAGWSCRCGPGPTQACVHVCVHVWACVYLVHSSGPETFPTLGFYGPLSSGIPGLLEQEGARWTPICFTIKVTWAGDSLCVLLASSVLLQ